MGVVNVDNRILDEIQRQADAMVRDLQVLPFLAMVPADRLRPLTLWGANLGLDSQALCRLVWAAGVIRLSSLGDDTEDLLAAVAGKIVVQIGGDNELPF